MGTLHEYLRRLVIISRLVLPRMRNISEKWCREKQNTQFMFNIFFSVNITVYAITWKNMAEPDRLQTAI